LTEITSEPEAPSIESKGLPSTDSSMSALTRFYRRFFWKAGAWVPALECLEASHGVRNRWNVTAAVSGRNQERHPLTVVELAGGKIIGDLRLVATAGDVVVGGLQGLFHYTNPPEHYLMQHWHFRPSRYRRGITWLLAAEYSDNYYHWLMNSLPRWRILLAANCPDYDFVLLPHRRMQFQDECLDRLNIPPEKRAYGSRPFVHHFERLIVPAMPFPSEAVSPWVCAWVRSLFPEKASGPEKIYLRRGPVGRCLVNEAELESALKPMGFVPIDPGRLTVAGQARLMSSARWVAGPHGAALTNIVFAPPGATLLELFHPEYKNRCYQNLAAACGHHYASLDGRAGNRPGAHELEYSIDVAAAVRMVAQMA
jgi:Glycosyltransferase 61